jgi:hypothetical protein
MQVTVTRVSDKVVELSTNEPGQLTLACLEVGKVFKVNVKIPIGDMPIGETLLVDTSSASTRG